MPNRKTWYEVMKSLSLLTQLSVMMVVCILGCGAIGFFLDKKLRVSPIFSVIFLILGVMSAFLSAYKMLKCYFIKRK